jgi:hypothetical protein
LQAGRYAGSDKSSKAVNGTRFRDDQGPREFQLSATWQREHHLFEWVSREWLELARANGLTVRKIEDSYCAEIGPNARSGWVKVEKISDLRYSVNVEGIRDESTVWRSGQFSTRPVPTVPYRKYSSWMHFTDVQGALLTGGGRPRRRKA